MCTNISRNESVDHMIDRLWRCELLSESEVRSLCNLAKEVISKEPNCLRVRAPVKVAHTF